MCQFHYMLDNTLIPPVSDSWPVLPPYPGNIRLTGFTQYSGSGRIEVYCNDEWGLVCNDGFTKNDADTVCRQLGYTEAMSYGNNYG